MKAKKLIPLLITPLLIATGAIGTTYGAVIIGNLPIDLPFRPSSSILYEATTGLNIAKQWENVVIYEMQNKPEKVEEIIEEVEIEDKTEDEAFAELTLIDNTSLQSYISNNPDAVANGYEKLFIDKVDLENTPTGIKTTQGDDVLGIDIINGITMVGVNVPYGDGQVAKVKLAIVDNKSQLGMSIVEDLSYWDNMETHVKREGAILGVNANGYTWNNTGDWANMYGAAKYKGELYRKAVNDASIICFSEDGTMSIGTDINSAYNVTEYYPALIQHGEVVYSAESDAEASVRMAQTAIGQTEDGKTIIAVASGGIYGSNNGITNGEMLAIMQRYGAVNASMLSGGSRSVMYWNGRVVSKHEGYQEAGVLLPTAIVVYPATYQ